MTGTFNLTVPAQPNPELEQIIRKHGSAMTVPAKEVFLTEERANKGVYYIISGSPRQATHGRLRPEIAFFYPCPGGILMV